MDTLQRSYVTKHSWRGKYKRILGLSKTALTTYNPSSYVVTNKFHMVNEIVDVTPSPKDPTQFNLVIRVGKKTKAMTFSSPQRSNVLTQICTVREMASKEQNPKYVPFSSEKYGAQRLKRNLKKEPVELWMDLSALTQRSAAGEVYSLYQYCDIDELCTVTDDETAFILKYGAAYKCQRIQVFYVSDRNAFLTKLIEIARKILGCELIVNGKAGAPGTAGTKPLGEYLIEKRKLDYADETKSEAPLSDFIVHKQSARYTAPVQRRLCLFDKAIIERDPTTYDVVSVHPYAYMMIIARDPDNPQRLVIHERGGKTSAYLSTNRDGLLTCIVDCARAAMNTALSVSTCGTVDAVRYSPIHSMSDKDVVLNIVRQLNEIGNATADEEKSKIVPLPYSSATWAPGAKKEEEAEPDEDELPSKEGAEKWALDDVVLAFVHNTYYDGAPEPDQGKQTRLYLGAMTSMLPEAKLTITGGLVRRRPSLTERSSSVSLSSTPPTSGVPAPIGTSSGKPPMPTPPTSDEATENKALTIALPPTLSETVSTLNSARDKKDETVGNETMPAASGAVVSLTVLQAVHRFVATRVVFEQFGDCGPLAERLLDALANALTSNDDLIVYSALDNISALLAPTADVQDLFFEQRNKRIILDQPRIVDAIIALLRKHISCGTGAMIVSACMDVLTYCLCEPYSATTSQDQFSKLLNKTAGLGRWLFKLFTHPSIGIVKTAGMIMKAIVEEGTDSRLKEMQSLSLTEAALLAHFNSAVFSELTGPRQRLHKELSKSLVSLWASGNALAIKMFFNVLPPGMMMYLRSNEEAETAVAHEGGEAADLKMDDDDKSGWWSHYRTKKRPVIVKREKKASRAVKNQMNWKMLFHQLGQDHMRADLIWNHHTREELRSALQSEIAAFNHQQSVHGTGTGISKGGDHVLSWNYKEFEVKYESLNNELQIGDYFIRILLNPPPGSKAPALHNPTVFFDQLYHRFLLEDDAALQDLCLQGMTVVYKHYAAKIGPFLDTPQILRILRSTTSVPVRDRLVVLLDKLLMTPENVKPFLDHQGVQLMVDLLTLVHLNEDKQVPPLGLGLLPGSDSSAKVVTEEWFYSLAVPSEEDKTKKKFQRFGPVTVEQLSTLYDDGTIEKITRVWAQGMERWQPLDEVTQLRWRLMAEGESVLTLVKLGQVILDMLIRLVSAFPSRDPSGAIIFPVPHAKALLSSPSCLPHLTQVFLTYEPSLVEKTAQLISKLVVDNLSVLPKLYQSGLFYFAMLYPGSNVLAVMQLMNETHKEQHFREGQVLKGSDWANRSVLSLILPPAMISVLDLYGPEKFSEIYLGDFDTPEAIWNQDMRRLMLEKLALHLNDFVIRLASHTMALYTYAPMAPISYPQINVEIFCHLYYLRHLCDVKRFPKWRVREPVQFLQAVLAAWEAELSKKASDFSKEEAFKALGLDPTKEHNENELRKAYYKLAAKYHPDKNPDGREIFEKIQTSYSLLTNTQELTGGPDPDRLKLLVRAQVVAYGRYSDDLKPYKYAGYPLLLPLVKQDIEDPQLFKETDPILKPCIQCMLLTIRTSPLNAEELARQDGITVLVKTLNRVLIPLTATSADADFATSVASLTMQTFMSVAESAACLDKMATFASFTPDIVKALSYSNCPKLIQSALEAVCVLAIHPKLQVQMTNSGILYRLVPMMLAYDYTLEEGGVEAKQENSPQETANAVAKLAVIALGRLSGLDQVAPLNENVRTMLHKLMTPVLAEWVCRKPANILLRGFNSNAATPTLIWNAGTRAELSGFITKQLALPPPHKPEDTLVFAYSQHTAELQLGSIYVRLYNLQPKANLKDAAYFTKCLLEFLQWRHDCALAALNKTAAPAWPHTGEEGFNVPIPVDENKHRIAALTAIRHLIDAQAALAVPMCAEYLGLLTTYLDSLVYPVSTTLPQLCINIIRALCSSEEIIKAFAEKTLTRHVIHTLYTLQDCTDMELDVLLALCSSNECVRQAIDAGALVLLSGVFMKVIGLTSVKTTVIGESQPATEGTKTTDSLALTTTKPQSGAIIVAGLASAKKPGSANTEEIAMRAKAGQVITRLVANKIHGPLFALKLKLVLPDFFVAQMAEDAESAVNMLDASHQTPELIWTKDIQTEVKKRVDELIKTWMKTALAYERKCLTTPAAPDTLPVFVMPDKLNISQLNAEINIGGIYVALFLGNPNYPLRQPRQFLEALLDKHRDYLACYIKGEKTLPNSEWPTKDYDGLLMLVSKCACALLQAQPAVGDHAATTGQLNTFITHLQACKGKVPHASVLPLLSQLCDNRPCVESFGAFVHTMPTLMAIINNAKEQVNMEMTVLIVEKMMLRNNCASGCLVVQSLACDLVPLMLKLLDQEGQFAQLVTPQIKARIVKALHTMCEDAAHGEAMNMILEPSPIWQQYRNQRHDLYLTNKTEVAGLLTAGASDTRPNPIGLLTAPVQEEEQGPPSAMH